MLHIPLKIIIHELKHFVDMVSVTFLYVSSTVSQVIDIVTEPEAQYYVAKKKPITITCEAFGADHLTFVCGEQEVCMTFI